MRNVYEVLREKEQLLETTQKEVQALRLVAPLLADPPQAQPRAVGSIPSVPSNGNNHQEPELKAASRWP